VTLAVARPGRLFTREFPWPVDARFTMTFSEPAEIVGFPHYAQFEDGPVAVGWLRASHREPDPKLSTEFLTVLAHRRALPVPRGQVTEVEIEILPSGTRFAAGEGLLLIVQGTDIKRYPKSLLYARHENTVNAGPHRIHTGGDHPSRIVLPILPA
jgi:uncharacterized protein